MSYNIERYHLQHPSSIEMAIWIRIYAIAKLPNKPALSEGKRKEVYPLAKSASGNARKQEGRE